MKSQILFWVSVIFLTTGCSAPVMPHHDKELRQMANDELMPDGGKMKPATTETYRFNNGMIIIPYECSAPMFDSGRVLN